MQLEILPAVDEVFYHLTWEQGSLHTPAEIYKIGDIVSFRLEHWVYGRYCAQSRAIQSPAFSAAIDLSTHIYASGFVSLEGKRP